MAPAFLPASGWLITGNLTTVNAGSGTARYFVGAYGVGAREVTGFVKIYDLSQSQTSPIISFPIQGGSRAEGGILSAIDNLDAEWDRIARETRNLIITRLPR